MNRLWVWFDRNLKGQKMFLFIIVAVVACAFFFFFLNVINEIDRQKLAEKRVDAEIVVNIISDFIRHDADHMTIEEWERNRDYLDEKVIANMEEIDSTFGHVAVVYKGKELKQISVRTHSFPADPFYPLDFPDFRADVLSNFGEYGTHDFTIFFTGDTLDPVDVHMVYRWVPVMDGIEDPYLIVIGASKYTVQTAIHSWLVGGIVFFGGYIAAMTFILVGYIIHIRNRRKEVNDVKTG